MKIDIGEDDNPEISMAPLIDCVFLLLIFFLVASSFDKGKEQEAKELLLDLPQSAAAISIPDGQTHPLIVGIDKRGKFYLNKQETSLKNLHQVLKQQAQIDKQRRIRIDGDRRVAFQHIVHIMDLCAFEGLTNIGVKTRGGS